MNRMQLILAINQHLKGFARRTRARAGGIADYFLFYIRQAIRYREHWMPPLTDAVLRKEIEDSIHLRGNSIFIQMSKDKHRGGEEIKAKIADCILSGRIIEKPLFTEYKKHFKGSRFTRDDWQRYNTDVITSAVLSGFLASLEPGAGTELPSHSFNLRTGKMKPMTVRDAGQCFVTWDYMEMAMAEVGLQRTMWSRETARIIEFDFHMAITHMHSEASYSDRFNFRRWWLEAHEQHKASIPF